jgi:trehalose-6-phosphate synthase
MKSSKLQRKFKSAFPRPEVEKLIYALEKARATSGTINRFLSSTVLYRKNRANADKATDIVITVMKISCVTA